MEVLKAHLDYYINQFQLVVDLKEFFFATVGFMIF